MTARIISPQFDNPVHDTQQAFRALLSATSKPGTIVEPPLPRSAPAPLTPALAAIALTLLDDTTSVWIDPALASDDVLRYLRFHTGAVVVAERSSAQFAMIATLENLDDLAAFPGGDASYPDRSATLIVQLPSLTTGNQVQLAGPGIEHTIAVAPAGLPQAFWTRWNENAGRYPCGIDIIFTDGRAVMGLPRTTKASF